jgi:hypothetical protein
MALLALAANCALACRLSCRGRRRGAAPWVIAQGRQGHWCAQTPAGVVQMLPRAEPTVLPLVVHLPFRRVPGGERFDLWVFRDAVSPQSWRQLRVRLNVRWHGAWRR